MWCFYRSEKSILDRVDHEIVLKKLSLYEIRGPENNGFILFHSEKKYMYVCMYV